MIRHLRVLLVATVCCFVLGAVHIASPPPADALSSHKIDSGNVCGNICNARRGVVDRPADNIAFIEAITSPKATMIAVQEMCVTQYNRLVGTYNFAGRGYSAYFSMKALAVSTPSMDPSCGDRFGIAIFVRGTPQGALFEGNLSPQPDLQIERVACIGTSYLSQAVLACNTHLDGDRSKSIQQSQSAYNTVALFFGNERRFVAGDFNTTSEVPWSSTYREGDPARKFTWRINDGNGPEEKIDFIWGDAAHQIGARDATAGCNLTQATDHCWLSANFRGTA